MAAGRMRDMTRVALERVTAEHPGFRALIMELDAELRQRYGQEQAAFDAFNGVAGIETALLVSDGSGWVGCACIRPIARDAGKYADVDPGAVELKRMYVTPDRRGRGFAGELIRGLEAWARELGFERMILELGDRQPEALAMYTRAGFAPVPKFGPYVAMPISICLGKSLLRAAPSGL
jgi:GNAT superfamily N-acetyltransferase